VMAVARTRKPATDAAAAVADEAVPQTETPSRGETP